MANLFPEWTNKAPIKVIIGVTLIVVAIILGLNYYFTPKYANVGYQPVQPVAFSHYLHAKQLGIDCRYCHTYVDRSEHSNIPSASTCMNCHNQVRTDSPALAPIRASYESGLPVVWTKVHSTPDYVYFNHSVHVNRGISCFECHGQVNEMDVIYQSKPLTMLFCLECHRKPQDYVRPLKEVYNLDWRAESHREQLVFGERAVHDWHIKPPLSCSGCHR